MSRVNYILFFLLLSLPSVASPTPGRDHTANPLYTSYAAPKWNIPLPCYFLTNPLCIKYPFLNNLPWLRMHCLGHVRNTQRKAVTPGIPIKKTADSPTTTPDSEQTLKTPAEYSAQDSIFFDIKQKKFHLYGESSIRCDKVKLEAEEIMLDWISKTISASAKQDEKGKWVGKPVFILQQEEKDRYGNPITPVKESQYIATKICYNIDSQRGIAHQLLTKQNDAILHAQKAKKDTEDTCYAHDVRYTTCNLTTPHFYIRAKKAKLVQDRKVISGPFVFCFNGVPTPPLGFFFGTLFLAGKRTMGIILPRFGENQEEGFYWRDGGWYINFNDYADFAIKGTLSTAGSPNLKTEINYKKRYQYGGSLQYQICFFRAARAGREKENKKKWKFIWKHDTDYKKNSTLISDVELGNMDFYSYDTLKKKKAKAKMKSNIRYTNRLVGLPYSLSATLQYDKTILSNNKKANNYDQKANKEDIGLTQCALPVQLSTRAIYPFRTSSNIERKWYTTLSFKHTTELQGKMSNQIGKDEPIAFMKNFTYLFKQGKYGVKHTLPIEARMKILKYCTVSPFFTPKVLWYWKELVYKSSYPTHEDVQPETKEKFRWVGDYSVGATLKVDVYGTYNLDPTAKIRSIRHILSPSLQFTYTPDFSKPTYNYLQTVWVGGKKEKYSKFKDFVYGGPAERAKAILTLKCGNKLFMKIGQGAEKTQTIPLFDMFDISTEYDFLADQFPLGTIDLKTSNSLFNHYIRIDSKWAFDPYIYEKNDPPNNQEKKINEFAWQHGKGLGRIQKASISINTRLGAKTGSSKMQESATRLQQNDLSNTLQYVPIDIPWSLSVGFEWQYKRGKEKNLKSIPFEGELSLTPKWKLHVRSCYDINQKELTEYSKVDITRDLHCWEMAFGWYPIGNQQCYDFSIGIKANSLKDIKYPRERKFSIYKKDKKKK